MRNRVFQTVVFGLLFLTFVGFFLFADASGLLGIGNTITPSTTIATVNGRNIPYQAWFNAVEGLREEQEQRLGRSITADERARLEQAALDEMVTSLLLEKEYDRRGI